MRARPGAVEIGLERVNDRLIGNQNKIVVLVGEPEPRKVARSGTQYLSIYSVSFQMHQNSRAFDPRENIGMGKQGLDEPPEANDDVAVSGVG